MLGVVESFSHCKICANNHYFTILTPSLSSLKMTANTVHMDLFILILMAACSRTHGPALFLLLRKRRWGNAEGLN